ncbi:hypothetical protein ACF0H5_001274 [Mactra antiquata]
MADVPNDGDTNLGVVENETNNSGEDEDCESFHDGQLSYIGRDVESIPQKLIVDYSKATIRLDLSFNQIKSLRGLEEFCNLEELVLDNNCINDQTLFPSLQQLHTLTLNKNQITDLDMLLQTIKLQFPKLTYLSLLGNSACPNQLSSHEKDDEDYLRYRYKVIYNFPQLKFLDSTPVTSHDLQEAKRVGPFMTVVRGSEKDIPVQDEVPSSPSSYTPLPDSSRQSDDHLGTFGKSKYVYYGKHSEGNRFIRNTDL